MILRKLILEDAVGMLEWINDPEVNRYFRFDVSNYDIDQAINFIKKSWKLQESIHLAVVDDLDEYLGTISLKNIDYDNKNAEYAISLRRKAGGTDAAKKATDIILYIAFLILGLNKVYFNVIKSNNRAISFYKKYGFQFEGEFRNHIIINGEYQDLELYGIFKSKYIELQTNNLDSTSLMFDKEIYDKEINMNNIASGAYIHENAIIGQNVIIRENVIVHNGAVIEDNVEIEQNSIIKSNVIVQENSFIGANSIIGEYSADYYHAKDNYLNKKTEIGKNSIIRSGAIIYNNVIIGENFQSGHRITIREESKIGKNSSIGTLCDLQGKLTIGNYVRLHSNVHIGQLSTIEDYVWIYPYVVLTNDPYPPMGELIGVTIKEYAQVATGSVIMPGVVIGINALVGAQALVKKDVADERVVVGVPAKDVCSIRDLKNNRGEVIYPWKEHLKDFRGYPWQIKK